VSFQIEWAALCGSALLLIVLAILIVRKAVRKDPEKRELRRRALVNRSGRLGDALVTGFTETLLHYTYAVNGVQYSASQEIAALRGRLPSDLDLLVGAARIKYLVKNPANSILLCEEWSGLRAPEPHSVAVAGG
jgi:hypothetical protein